MAFLLGRDLASFEGASAIERARIAIARDYERRLHLPLTGVALVPFESARGGTWKWIADLPVSPAPVLRQLPTKILFDVSPDSVGMVTVAGTSDDEGLARRVTDSVKTTSDPKCYWSDLEALYRKVPP